MDIIAKYGTYSFFEGYSGERYMESLEYKGKLYAIPPSMLEELRKKYNNDVIDVRKFFIDKNKPLDY